MIHTWKNPDLLTTRVQWSLIKLWASLPFLLIYAQSALNSANTMVMLEAIILLSAHLPFFHSATNPLMGIRNSICQKWQERSRLILSHKLIVSNDGEEKWNSICRTLHVEPEAYPISLSPLPWYNLLIFRFHNLRKEALWNTVRGVGEARGH